MLLVMQFLLLLLHLQTFVAVVDVVMFVVNAFVTIIVTFIALQTILQ
jgi:hypothetical protein